MLSDGKKNWAYTRDVYCLNLPNSYISTYLANATHQ